VSSSFDLIGEIFRFSKRFWYPSLLFLGLGVDVRSESSGNAGSYCVDVFGLSSILIFFRLPFPKSKFVNAVTSGSLLDRVFLRSDIRPSSIFI
jgi:hypothetical protein